tara:strand:- start:706 stop:1854 length:1149 start_codon:yes stop_codon:yes gene_type:complete
VKKLLLIHNNYRETGGEDIAVQNELSILKKYFIVETVVFSNQVSNYFGKILLFFSSKSKSSENKLRDVVTEFKPDVAYVHNTWFNASLSVFDILKEENIKTILKLHNFRYFCTRTFFHKRHIKDNEVCFACGQKKNKLRFFNKYYRNSYLKSLMVIFYGKRYFKVLQGNDLKLLVLTQFHKNFLQNLGVNKEKITVLPNLINLNLESVYSSESNYIVYAGRISEEKGIDELIRAFLDANLSNLTLKIIGNGPSINDLKKKYIGKPVDFINEISNADVLDIISKSKGVVTATKLYEGQPTLLCEASTLGVPSFFPESGGIAEFFPKDYDLSYKQFDYVDLQNKLKTLNNLETLTNQGKKNKEFISSYLDEQILVEKFKKVIDE